MSKRLRKISELAFPNRIVFLGQKPEIVSQRQQSLEQLFRFFGATD
jgi:hypothetical protein